MNKRIATISMTGLIDKTLAQFVNNYYCSEYASFIAQRYMIRYNKKVKDILNFLFRNHLNDELSVVEKKLVICSPISCIKLKSPFVVEGNSFPKIYYHLVKNLTKDYYNNFIVFNSLLSYTPTVSVLDLKNYDTYKNKILEENNKLNLTDEVKYELLRCFPDDNF